jgi:predicted dehydrogenase
MKTRKLRVGIIGTGGIAQSQHIPHWKKLPDVEVVAVADTHIDTLKRVAKQFEVPHMFTSHRELLKLPLDVVDICTPNIAHTPATLDALEAGCHVLCEKPLAVTTREVKQMGQLADRRKRKLMTAQFQRFTQAARTIREWADHGGLGDTYHARVHAMRRSLLPTRRGFISKALAGGGPTMDIGVHALDTCMWVMDFPKPVRVTGSTKTVFAKGKKIPGMWGEWDRKEFTVEDFAAGFVHFDNGATMILEASWLGHQPEDEDLSFQLFGTNGGIKWPSCQVSTVQGRTFVTGNIARAGWTHSAYEDQIKAFHRAVVDGKPSPVPWTETIKVIGILEAVYRSQQEGREVKVAS